MIFSPSTATRKSLGRVHETSVCYLSLFHPSTSLGRSCSAHEWCRHVGTPTLRGSRAWSHSWQSPLAAQHSRNTCSSVCTTMSISIVSNTFIHHKLILASANPTGVNLSSIGQWGLIFKCQRCFASVRSGVCLSQRGSLGEHHMLQPPQDKMNTLFKFDLPRPSTSLYWFMTTYILRKKRWIAMTERHLSYASHHDHTAQVTHPSHCLLSYNKFLHWPKMKVKQISK